MKVTINKIRNGISYKTVANPKCLSGDHARLIPCTIIRAIKKNIDECRRVRLKDKAVGTSEK